mmetsp:Transcript_13163/g.26727  ORF Transcript_13163/g.26727 Transcript_13163/m.26727 type:complete len:562 (-) Transcript_13163:2457-4142(-)
MESKIEMKKEVESWTSDEREGSEVESERMERVESVQTGEGEHVRWLSGGDPSWVKAGIWSGGRAARRGREGGDEARVPVRGSMRVIRRGRRDQRSEQWNMVEWRRTYGKGGRNALLSSRVLDGGTPEIDLMYSWHEGVRVPRIRNCVEVQGGSETGVVLSCGNRVEQWSFCGDPSVAGWREMGHIDVGAEVLGLRGSPSQVAAVCPNFFTVLDRRSHKVNTKVHCSLQDIAINPLFEEEAVGLQIEGGPLLFRFDDNSAPLQASLPFAGSAQSRSDYSHVVFAAHPRTLLSSVGPHLCRWDLREGKESSLPTQNFPRDDISSLSRFNMFSIIVATQVAISVYDERYCNQPQIEWPLLMQKKSPELLSVLSGKDCFVASATRHSREVSLYQCHEAEATDAIFNRKRWFNITEPVGNLGTFWIDPKVNCVSGLGLCHAPHHSSTAFYLFQSTASGGVLCQLWDKPPSSQNEVVSVRVEPASPLWIDHSYEILLDSYNRERWNTTVEHRFRHLEGLELQSELPSCQFVSQQGPMNLSATSRKPVESQVWYSKWQSDWDRVYNAP